MPQDVPRQIVGAEGTVLAPLTQARTCTKVSFFTVLPRCFDPFRLAGPIRDHQTSSNCRDHFVSRWHLSSAHALPVW
ncbi:hypothetical protein CC2G_012646 [Coprinopsis cinerea AmutBmut pab1-1]|nr:hypothetical protein CC2G_012646 [Coprinopsis cinerea AmutBmut pab1-1]